MLCEHSLPAGQVLSTVVKEKQTKRSRAVLCGENMVEVFLTFAHFGEVQENMKCLLKKLISLTNGSVVAVTCFILQYSRSIMKVCPVFRRY